MKTKTYPRTNRREGGTFLQTAARSEDAGVVGEALRQGRATQPQEAKMSSLPMRGFGIGSKYLLRYHDFYSQRIAKLKEQVRELRGKLDDEAFGQHEIVKLAYRIRQADQEIIPEDPNRPEYRLTGDLKKYRRYKQGLQRYRLFFCFSNQPEIILYLYLNDEKHLRKDGDKNDPYEEFKSLVKKEYFSHNPADPKIQKWIKSYRL